jgi:hypothetical protein
LPARLGRWSRIRRGIGSRTRHLQKENGERKSLSRRTSNRMPWPSIPCLLSVSTSLCLPYPQSLSLPVASVFLSISSISFFVIFTLSLHAKETGPLAKGTVARDERGPMTKKLRRRDCEKKKADLSSPMPKGWRAGRAKGKQTHNGGVAAVLDERDRSITDGWLGCG